MLKGAQRRSRLVVATSHYEEVKRMASAEDGAVNAAVEFDVATLRPTYRLLWGESGESNALEIAKGYGLSEGLLDAARKARERSEGRDRAGAEER